MSYVMCSHIVFPAIRGRRELNVYAVNSVKVESSWKMLTDTAEIILPRKVRDFRNNRISELFREGDPVEIRLGYNDELYTEFIGYITKVSAGVPVTLRLEDEMYALKRRTVSVSMKNTNLKTLLQEIAPGYKIDCYDGVELGSVRYTNISAAQVLEEVGKKTGMRAYFDGKVLRCGKVYGDQIDEPPVNVYLERNAVSEELNRKDGGEYKIQVKAVSILKGGKKLEVKIGDSGGTVKQLSYVGITAKTELEKIARADYERLKRKGFDGKVVLFGLPRIVQGQKINLKSELCPELDGTYYVDKVTKEFSDSATYRQTIELGDEYGG